MALVLNSGMAFSSLLGCGGGCNFVYMCIYNYTEGDSGWEEGYEMFIEMVGGCEILKSTHIDICVLFGYHDDTHFIVQ